ncbi:hypothetical protein ACIP6X_28040 [Streptomyces coeruleorubidus]|uniref:hypothetical protein n=1 Tax=Streptomyces coeruleorubidus TaxID=116188 RepID=UPI00380A3833
MEDRQVINGMVYKIRTGISWRDLARPPRPSPRRYGPVGRFMRARTGGCVPLPRGQ